MVKPVRLVSEVNPEIGCQLDISIPDTGKEVFFLLRVGESQRKIIADDK